MCNSKDFAKMATTRLGSTGEDILEQYFKNKGYAVDRSDNSKSHLIDFTITKNNKTIFVDAKTKPRRLYYDDTGFDLADFHKYKNLQLIKKNKVLVIFIDYVSKSVYGNTIMELDKQYKIKGNIIYFPLSNMRKLFDLTDEAIKQLKGSTTANMKYLDKI
jgi:Holliday junction resolvase